MGVSKHCSLTIFAALKALAWLEQEMTYVVYKSQDLTYNNTTLLFYSMVEVLELKSGGELAFIIWHFCRSPEHPSRLYC